MRTTKMTPKQIADKIHAFFPDVDSAVFLAAMGDLDDCKHCEGKGYHMSGNTMYPSTMVRHECSCRRGKALSEGAASFVGSITVRMIPRDDCYTLLLDLLCVGKSIYGGEFAPR